MIDMCKREFIVLINIMLSFANAGIKSCCLNYGSEDEVILRFNDGRIKNISIACDSRIAIIKDIIAAVE